MLVNTLSVVSGASCPLVFGFGLGLWLSLECVDKPERDSALDLLITSIGLDLKTAEKSGIYFMA